MSMNYRALVGRLSTPVDEDCFTLLFGGTLNGYVPGENDIDFEFKVHKPFGNELVKVYASDKPLPDLPGQDVGYGFKKMDLDIKEIQERYTGYATSQGVRLAQDVLPIVTRP